MKKMKWLPVLLLACAPKAMAQCQQPTALPYMADIESVAAPSLPQCMMSMWESFASQEVFESTETSVPGFTGKLLVYDTTINTEFGMPANAWIRAGLSTPQFYMEQGTAYTVSFRYGNSDPNLVIGLLNISLNGVNGDVQIDALENVTGATPINYVSMEFTPPSTGNYAISLTVESEGTQGQLYLDNITVQSTGVMGIAERMASRATIYPNPAKNVVTLSNTAAIDSVEMYNTAGQLVLAEKPNALSSDITLSNLASGIYIAHIKSGSRLEKVRIIKQ